MDWKKIAAVTLVGSCSLSTMGAAKGCDDSDGPARSATHAGDGITQFGDGTDRNYANKGSTGKLKWNRTYNAHKTNPQDVENCEWSLYRIDKLGRTVFIKKGGYGTAKVNVGEQVTQKVYLKSLDCGFWE